MLIFLIILYNLTSILNSVNYKLKDIYIFSLYFINI